jgi:murein DD-endopeptidase MepM/ murein hydrolase activator NlpD
MTLLAFVLLAGATNIAVCQTFRLARPVPDTIQTNGSYLYGEPRLGNSALAHTGIDIAIAYDTVRSASEVTVWFIGYDPNDPTGGYEPTGCGNYILVQSQWNGQPLYLLYCHLTRPLLALNEQVHAGTPVAISGTTGNSTGPPYTTFSWALTYNFADPAIGSDDRYQENYAIGDVKPEKLWLRREVW